MNKYDKDTLRFKWDTIKIEVHKEWPLEVFKTRWQRLTTSPDVTKYVTNYNECACKAPADFHILPQTAKLLPPVMRANWHYCASCFESLKAYCTVLFDDGIIFHIKETTKKGLRKKKPLHYFG